MEPDYPTRLHTFQPQIDGLLYLAEETHLTSISTVYMDEDRVKRIQYLHARVSIIADLLDLFGYDSDAQRERADQLEEAYKRCPEEFRKWELRGPTHNGECKDTRSSPYKELLTLHINMLLTDPTDKIILRAVSNLQEEVHDRMGRFPSSSEVVRRDSKALLKKMRIHAIVELRTVVEIADIPDGWADCPICYRNAKDFKFKMVKLICGQIKVPHFFCRPCLTRHLLEKTKCPSCNFDHIDAIEEYEEEGAEHGFGVGMNDHVHDEDMKSDDSLLGDN